MTLIKNNVNIDGNVDMQNNNITNANIISATSIYSISSYTHYQDIIVSELSGFRVTGNIEITGNVIAQGDITANNLLIGNWNSVYTTVNGTSANWDSVYNQVCSLSSNWSPDYISGSLTPIYDSRYVNITGDTMSGNLTISATDPEIRLTNIEDGEYARLVKTNTSNGMYLYNIVDKPGTNAYALNKSDFAGGNFVQGGNVNETGDWTVSLWINTTEYPGTIAYPFSFYTGAVGIYIWGLSNNCQMGISDGSTVVQGSTTTPLGNWFLATATKSGTSYVLYYNGNIENSGSLSDIDITTFRLFLRGDGSWPYKGKIDDVGIWNRALSQAEIQLIYNSGTGTYSNPANPPWNSGLQHLYRLDEGTGTVLIDNYGAVNGTITGLSWIEGHVPTDAVASESQIIKSENGIGSGENGVNTFGDADGRTILDGQTIRFNINGTEEFQINSTGDIVFPSNQNVFLGNGASILALSGNITASNLNINNWNSVYTTVQSNSSTNWNYQGADLKALSGNWQSTYITMTSLSGNWESVYNQVCSLSATWESNINYISASIGNLSAVYLTPLSADLTYEPIIASGTTSQYYRGDKTWQELPVVDLTEVSQASGNWNSVYNQVCSLSSTWGTGGPVDLGEIPSLSSNWNSAFYQMTALSGNWESTYTTVQSNSSDWSSAYSYCNGISGIEGEPNGFPNRTDSVLNLDPTTKIFTVSAASTSYDIWFAGQKYTFTDSFSAQMLSGSNFIYLNSSGERTHSQNAWGILNDAQISYVYYDPYSDRAFGVEERHGLIMDRMTHYYLHMSDGTKWINGLAIGNYNLSPASPALADVQYSIGSGTVADEDIISSVNSLSAAGPYTLMFRNGSTGFWSICANSHVPFLTAGSGDIAYNINSGGTWSITPITTNNRWVNYYVFATTSYTPGYNVIIIPGQTIYTTLALAQAETLYNLTLGSLPFQELVAVAKVTSRFSTGAAYTAATGRSRIEAVDRLLGTKLTVTGGIAPSNHGTLTGRSDANSHPAAAISTDVTNFGNIISTDATNVQTALDEIDNHTHSEITGLVSLSGNWQSTYTTVSSNSANWNVAYTAASGSSFGSADNIAITWTPTNYTITTNDVSGNFKGIDNALGGVTFNGTTIVTSVTSSGKWLTMSINGSAYALPLYLYS